MAFMGHLDSKPWTVVFSCIRNNPKQRSSKWSKVGCSKLQKHDLLQFRKILSRSNPKIWMLEDVSAVGICKASLKGSAPNQMTLRFGDRVCHICLEPQIWNDLKPAVVASLHKKRADVFSVAACEVKTSSSLWAAELVAGGDGVEASRRSPAKWRSFANVTF